MGWRRVLLLFALALSTACDTDVEIVAHCEPITDAVRLIDRPGAIAPFVGRVDGHVLLAWVEEEVVGDHDEGFLWTVWLDESLQPESEPRAIGHARTTINRSRWVAWDGALWAQQWMQPDLSAPVGSPDDEVVLLRMRPPPEETVEIVVPSLAISHVHDPPCTECSTVGLGDGVLWAGRGGELAATSSASGPVFAIEAVPAACASQLANLSRLHLFDGSRSALVSWSDDVCDATITGFDDYVHNAAIVALDDGSIGAIFRVGSGVGYGYVHYLRISSDLVGIGDPVRVGAAVPIGYEPGFQPHAIAVGERVLFTERTDDYRRTLNGCSELRLVAQDGSSSGSAPWQLPCRSSGGTRFTASLDLLRLAPDRAVVAWGERTGFGDDSYRQVLTTHVAWSEGVYAAVVTAAGRRGSEIVRVTDDAATALSGTRSATAGPFPAELFVAAANEGDDVVVTWLDTRADAPGIYGRALRCAPAPPR